MKEQIQHWTGRSATDLDRILKHPEAEMTGDEFVAHHATSDAWMVMEPGDDDRGWLIYCDRPPERFHFGRLPIREFGEFKLWDGEPIESQLSFEEIETIVACIRAGWFS